MKPKLAEFWRNIITDPCKDRTRKSVRQKRTLQLRVVHYLRRVHPKIFAGMPDAKFSSDDGTNLFKQLKRSANTQEFFVIQRFLIKGLEAGKEELGWPEVKIPVPATTAPREPSRFTPESFRHLNEVLLAQASFVRFLEFPPEANPSRHLGTILLSAVLFGGMLTPKWLTPLLRGLPDRVRMSGSLMWLELRRPYIYPKLEGHEEKRKHIPRRWLPDPLTQALILRLHTRYQHHLPACSRLDAITCLKTVLNHIAGEHETLSVRGLYKGAGSYLALRMPVFLASYACGKTNSVSLPVAAWSRFLTGKGNVVSEAVDDEEYEDEEPAGYLIVRSTKSADQRMQEKFRKELISILGDSRRNRITPLPTRKLVEATLKAKADAMTPIVQTLYGWAIELLSRIPKEVPGRTLKSALQPSSVATYLEAIDRELIAQAGIDDITRFEPAELRDLYADSLKSIKETSQLPTASFRLTQFHFFLMRAYGVPSIDMDGMVRKKGPPELGVDANLIGPVQFDQVLVTLGWQLPVRSRNQIIRCLVAILGYRCGLRHSEALCLRIGDLMGEQFPEIIVRTSGLNRTKTPDSTRRIPAHLLLEPKELDELRYWHRQRIAEEGCDTCLNAPLFGEPGDNHPPPDSEVITPIIRMLRHVTGDPTVVFHHLRHSFATRLLMIMLPEQLSGSHLNDTIKKFCRFHLPAEQLITGLFGNMNQGRQFLYGISILMGHADVSTTMLSYLHLCDWLLGQAVCASAVQPDLSLAAVMQITGLKRAMIFRIKSGNKGNDWRVAGYLEWLYRHANKLFPDVLADVTAEIALPQPQVEAEEKSVPNWKLVEQTLKLRQVQGMAYPEISRRLRLSPAIVETWCTAAEQIRGMITTDGTPRHLTSWQRKRINNGAETKMLFPTPPDIPEDKEIVTSIFKAIESLPPAELEEIKAGSRLFVENYSTNQGYIRFTTIAAAAWFNRFLKQAGVQEKMIYVTMFTKFSPPKPDELLAQRKVLLQIGIHPGRVLTSGKRHIRYRRSHECSVAYLVVWTAPPIKRKPKKAVPLQMRYGFRYAMYLLTIGFSQEESMPSV